MADQKRKRDNRARQKCSSDSQKETAAKAPERQFYHARRKDGAVLKGPRPRRTLPPSPGEEGQRGVEDHHAPCPAAGWAWERWHAAKQHSHTACTLGATEGPALSAQTSQCTTTLTITLSSTEVNSLGKGFIQVAQNTALT